MDKLSEAIANTAYILDCLRNLRSIYETGDCNSCGIEAICKVKPIPGQMVRYNCPFYVKDGDAHCAGFSPDCPKKCFRAQLVRDLKLHITDIQLPVSWLDFRGTTECMRGIKDGKTD